MKKIITGLLVFLLLLACSKKAIEDDSKNKISGKDVHAAFDRDFRKYYKDDYFSRPYDTCILRQYIEEEIDSVSSFAVHSFNRWVVFHDEQKNLPISYSVVKNSMTGESFFYGHYDAYALYDVDTLQIKHFENLALNEILKTLLVSDGSDPVEFLKPYIYNIYFTILDDKREISAPIFPYILTHWQFKSRYRNNTNSEEFDKLFPEAEQGDILVISNDRLGALVFKVRTDNKQSFEIEEFLIAARGRIPLFQVDGVPLYYEECKSTTKSSD
jgi:hypothetical protein